MAENWRLNRREALRGAGVTLLLPLLDAMETKAAAANALPPNVAAKAPVRFAALYMPNGVNVQAWQPEGIGSDWKLSPTLSPLASVKEELLVFSELMNKESQDGDGHYVKVAPFLTGTHVTKTTGSDLRCGGVSMDQVIAQRIGIQTPLPSLELSVEPVTDGVDTNVGFTRLYGSHISWSSPTTPVSREINPQMAFDRLFRPAAQRAGAATEKDASILDAVLADAKRLQSRVGKEDRAKLGEYFEAVRSVERRIAFDGVRRKAELLDDPKRRDEINKLGARIRDFYAVPEGKRGIDHTEQVRIMMDLVVLAFWTDATRVATFMFGNEVSGKNFSFLPGVDGGHHQISHHENDKAKLEQYQKINQWHVAQYGYLLERLKGIKEGQSNLLHNSMILFGSGMKDGNAHSPHNLPIVLAGRAGGTLATNRYLTYDKKTPLCNLYTGLLARAGTPVPRFGDSTGELTGLSDPTYKGLTPAPAKPKVG